MLGNPDKKSNFLLKCRGGSQRKIIEILNKIIFGKGKFKMECILEGRKSEREQDSRNIVLPVQKFFSKYNVHFLHVYVSEQRVLLGTVRGKQESCLPCKSPKMAFLTLCILLKGKGIWDMGYIEIDTLE